MRKILCLFFLITVSAFAQIQPTAPPQGNLNGDLYASGYGGWTVPMGNNGGLSWSSGTFCTASYGGTTFAAFTVGTPITINDLINPANSEVVTVTNVISTSNQCSISITTPVRQHQSFNLGSATAGIQEAINANFGTKAPLTIHLTADWYRLGGVLSMVTTTAQGNASIGIVDDTQTPSNWYQWTGSHYTLVSVGGGGTSAVFTASTPGIVPGSRAAVYQALIAGGADACSVINTQTATLQSTNGVVDATWLLPGTYTCVNPIRLNTAQQAVSLWLQDGVNFVFNTVLGSSKSPNNCAVSVGPGGAGTFQPNGGSSIIVFGHNRLGGANFSLGPNAVVWGLVCNGAFDGSQESMSLDGVGMAGYPTATLGGALLYLGGINGPTIISNSGTQSCFGQCLEVDAGDGSYSYGAGDIMFFNDTFIDEYQGSQIYPGSVVGFNTLGTSGGIGNVVFLGGLINGNGPHNPLLTFQGNGSVQLSAVTFHNTYLETNTATPSTYWTNVDPIQITDASQIWVDTWKVGGNHGTSQPNLIDISATRSNTTYSILIDQLSTGAGGYSCLINNAIDGTCEKGFPTGGGELEVPPYNYGGVTPSVRLENYAPPSSACFSTTLGTVWINSTDTSSSGPASYCQIQGGIIGWYKPAGSGGGGSGSAITALAGDVTATGPGSVTATVTGLNGTPLAPLGAGLLQINGSGIPSKATSVSVAGQVQAGTYSRSGVNAISSCTGTITFDASLGDYQQCTLGGNVTSATLANTPASNSGYGQLLHLQICQPSSGGPFTFAPISGVKGWTPVTLIASTCTTESFTVNSGNVQSDAYNSANCIQSGSPAVCAQAIQGEVAVPAGTNPSLTINTTGYIATSQLIFTPDSTIGGDLSVTCNATIPSGWMVTAEVPGISVTLTLSGTFSTNPVCGRFTVRNS